MNLAEFKEKATKDKAYAKKFDGIGDVEKIVEIAKQDGYNFTVDDFKKDTNFPKGPNPTRGGWIIYKGFIQWDND